jgi:hypothetical protein
VKSGTFSFFRLHPDSPAVPFDDFPADSQPYAVTRILPLRMKTLENLENPLVVLRVDAVAVVAD